MVSQPTTPAANPTSTYPDPLYAEMEAVDAGSLRDLVTDTLERIVPWAKRQAALTADLDDAALFGGRAVRG